MHKTSTSKLLTVSIFASLIIFSICLIGLLYSDEIEIGSAAVLLLIIALFSVLIIPLLHSFRRKEFIRSNRLKVYGKGMFLTWLSISVLVTGIITITLIFILGKPIMINELIALLLGLMNIFTGITQVQHGFINMQNKTLSVKGKDFYFKNIKSISIAENELVIIYNETIYQYNLSRLTKDETREFLTDLSNSEFTLKMLKDLSNWSGCGEST